MVEETGLSHVEQRVRRDFVDRFVRVRVKRGKEPPVDLDWLARAIVAAIDEEFIPDQPALERACNELLTTTSGFPVAKRFIDALKAVIGGQKPAKPSRPDNWRWKPHRGGKSARPLGISEVEWELARDRQERAATHLLKNDLDAQVLARAAWEQDWLVALADFVTEHGRLPSPDEERKCRAIASRSRQELGDLEVQELQAQNQLIERVARGEKMPKGEPGTASISSTALRKLRATMTTRWAEQVIV